MAEYHDRYGLAVTTGSGEAFEAYTEAFDLALAQCEGAAGLLERAIAADDTFPLAWSALSLQQRSRGDVPGANASLRRALAGAGDLTDREQGHLSVLESLAFDISRAESALHAHLARWPRDALIVSQARLFYIFLSPQPDRYRRMKDLFKAVAPGYSDDWYILGELAFAAEENHEYPRARDLAEESLGAYCNNAMAAHPMAHVFLETGDLDAGAAWLRGWLADWDRPGQFACHLTWHLALFELAREDLSAATGLLARVVSFAGRSNAALSDGASLAWRLKLDGAQDGLPWTQLSRLPDPPSFTFANAHHALVLAGLGDAEGLAAYIQALDLSAGSGHPTASACAEFSRGLRELTTGDYVAAATRMHSLLPQFRRFGGSHVQSEVFEDTAIAALGAAGRHSDATELLTARLRSRPSGRDQAWLARLG
jgi:tetratricopeptide (TPR) repeat protein